MPGGHLKLANWRSSVHLPMCIFFLVVSPIFAKKDAPDPHMKGNVPSDFLPHSVEKLYPFPSKISHFL